MGNGTAHPGALARETASRPSLALGGEAPFTSSEHRGSQVRPSRLTGPMKGVVVEAQSPEGQLHGPLGVPRLRFVCWERGGEREGVRERDSPALKGHSTLAGDDC